MKVKPRQIELQEWYAYWESQQSGDETPDEADAALLALILEARRIMLGIPTDDPRLGEMEQQTLELLRQPDFLPAKFSQLEVVFRRLAEGRSGGWAYLTEAIESRSAKFAGLASRERKKDIFSQVIGQLVAENPKISENEVFRNLIARPDFQLSNDEIRYIGDDEESEAESLPVHRLRTRLHEAKKRHHKKNSP